MGIIIFIIVILLISSYYATTSEKFDSLTNTSTPSSQNDNVDVLLFFSDQCGHCTTFKKKKLPKLTELSNSDSNYNLKTYDSKEDTQKYFNKYNIEYIPAGKIVKGDKVIDLNLHIPNDNEGEKIYEKILEIIKELK